MERAKERMSLVVGRKPCLRSEIKMVTHSFKTIGLLFPSSSSCNNQPSKETSSSYHYHTYDSSSSHRSKYTFDICDPIFGYCSTARFFFLSAKPPKYANQNFYFDYHLKPAHILAEFVPNCNCSCSAIYFSTT